MTEHLSNAAAILGKSGGLVKTPKKAKAARKNGKKGGRPPKSNAVKQ